MADWLESEFLEEQVQSIKEISEYITNLKRVGPGLGEYMFDKETLDEWCLQLFIISTGATCPL